MLYPKTHLYGSWTRFTFVIGTAIVGIVTAAGQAGAQERWGGVDSWDRSSGFERWQGNDWLSGQSSSQQWNLGVTGDSGITGFVVRQVASGGAADRARIQPRDVIITVEGFQIGQVSGRLYDLNQELNRRADASGAVQLLLQDGQSGRLASVRVQLDGQSNTLKGSIVSPQSLPPDTLITVQIENVTRPNWVVRNGQQVLPAGNQLSIPFQIAYDPQFLLNSDVYQVRAIASSGGRDIMYSAPMRVITQGNPVTAQLRLERIASTGGSGNAGNVMSAGYINYNELDRRVVQLYREYLGRDPSDGELAASRVLGTSVTNTLERLPLKLMASQEYFDLARNNNEFWLANVFEVIVGRKPRADEIAQWRQRFSELRFSRTELLRQLKQQSSF